MELRTLDFSLRVSEVSTADIVLGVGEGSAVISRRLLGNDAARGGVTIEVGLASRQWVPPDAGVEYPVAGLGCRYKNRSVSFRIDIVNNNDCIRLDVEIWSGKAELASMAVLSILSQTGMGTKLIWELDSN